MDHRRIAHDPRKLNDSRNLPMDGQFWSYIYNHDQRNPQMVSYGTLQAQLHRQILAQVRHGPFTLTPSQTSSRKLRYCLLYHQRMDESFPGIHRFLEKNGTINY